MAVCPHCHKMDKPFFAERCPNCIQYVGFAEQCVHSLIWTVVPLLTIAVILGFLWLFLG